MLQMLEKLRVIDVWGNWIRIIEKNLISIGKWFDDCTVSVIVIANKFKIEK